MRQPAKAITFSVALLAILATLALWFVSQHQVTVERIAERERKFSAESLLVPEPQRPLSDASYTPSGYIIPLENNAKSSIYSPRAQVRGTVKRWSGQILTIAVSPEETKDIVFAAAVRLYCTPTSFTDANGNRVPATRVWVNIQDNEQTGTLVEIADLIKKFPAGKNILVYVNVGEEDAMAGDLVVGYGCTER